MKYIIDFYQDLDTLNLIIFWGIIIVIILLVIVVIILEKNKKTSRKNNLKEEMSNESLPIAENIHKPIEPLIEETHSLNQVSLDNQTGVFNAEEHVIEYHDHFEVDKNLNDLTPSKISNVNPQENTPKEKEPFPNKPYQRNVLREMALSQTSPIGIVKNDQNTTKTNILAKELHNSLNIEKTENELEDMQYPSNKSNSIPHIDNPKNENSQSLSLSTPEITINKLPENKNTNPLIGIEIDNPTVKSNESNSMNYGSNHQVNQPKTIPNSFPKPVSSLNENHTFEKKISSSTNDSLNNYLEKNKLSSKNDFSPINSTSSMSNKTIDSLDEKSHPSSHEPTYLEEVSSKLASSQNLDYVDRTEYELKQEEEAIISYEELMQKKDQIKMIDEEEAVISIEELLQKQKKDEKLYQLTDEEENDKFIRELKDFRNDL